jgi:hypothetical protein
VADNCPESLFGVRILGLFSEFFLDSSHFVLHADGRPMKNFIPAACALSLLSGCSTVIEGSSQQVMFETVGALDAACSVMLGENKMRYTVYPPQKIWIKKSAEPMNIFCQAPGNRTRTIIVESEVAGTTFLNVFNGTLGGFYDGQSGAMFKYPDNVIVDFSDTVAELAPLPSYHNTDTIPPDQPGIEYMGPDTPKLQEDASVALRRRMAQMKADQDAAAEAALEAEKEARKSMIEDEFVGDKESPKKSSSKKDSYVPPATDPAEVKDESSSEKSPAADAKTAAPPPETVTVPNEAPTLPGPTFPATTSF